LAIKLGNLIEFTKFSNGNRKQTTIYLSSAQEINADILEAIKIAFKSKAITITIEEQDLSEVNEDTKEVLDYRLK
jgi:MarR-like DNA-binding transcriptional regulator SgrR of sgrS sRNA